MIEMMPFPPWRRILGQRARIVDDCFGPGKERSIRMFLVLRHCIDSYCVYTCMYSIDTIVGIVRRYEERMVVTRHHKGTTCECSSRRTCVRSTTSEVVQTEFWPLPCFRPDPIGIARTSSAICAWG